MKRLGEISILALICFSVPAAAAEMPSRKAGLWEIKTNTGVPNVPQIAIRQCIDATTDQQMQPSAGPPGATRQCSQSDVAKSGDTVTVDSICTVGGKSVTSHAVIDGSFDSSYTMTVTAQGEGMPGGSNVTVTAKWLGPCAADQRPGDMIMPNGMKINILDARKRGASGAPGGMMAPPPGMTPGTMPPGTMPPGMMPPAGTMAPPPGH